MRRPVGDGIGWRDPRYTHQCPVCLLLTEGEQTCVGDQEPSIMEAHNPCRTLAMSERRVAPLEEDA